MLRQVCEYFSAFLVNQQIYPKRMEIECKRSNVIYRYSEGTDQFQEEISTVGQVKSVDAATIVEAAPTSIVIKAPIESIIVNKQRNK